MNTVYSSIHEMCIRRNKEIDDAILGEIRQMAIENGIRTELVLNDKAIINALEKQIPKKPIKDEEGCLVCGNCGSFDGIRIDTSFNEGFCHKCGQAIDWGDSE